jgi:hypothetical protein
VARLGKARQGPSAESHVGDFFLQEEAMSENKGRLFIGGVPTGPSVALLEAKFGDVALGESVPYAEIAAVIGVDRHAGRFNVVVSRWRDKLLKERNIRTTRTAGTEAVYFCGHDERAGLVYGGLRQGAKHFRKCATHAAMIPGEKLEEADRRKVTHVRMVAMVMADATTVSVNQLAETFRAPRQLPKRALG